MSEKKLAEEAALTALLFGGGGGASIAASAAAWEDASTACPAYACPLPLEAEKEPILELAEKLDVLAPTPAELPLLEPAGSVGGGRDHVPPVLTKSLKERPAACKPLRKA